MTFLLFLGIPAGMFGIGMALVWYGKKYPYK